MIILSHRGYWKTPDEKNTRLAFERSFALGFGTETDLRDHNGRLVISHDPPEGDPLSADAFFQMYQGYDNPDLPLALNIKADGLQALLLRSLQRWAINNYFVFDMSVPDALLYVRGGIRAFTRQSEYETAPSFYAETEGVWLDCFEGDWITAEAIATHRGAGKQVCLVSPDLHKRPHLPFWERLRATLAPADLAPGASGVLLCTDYPEEARAFFQEQESQ